MQRQQVGNVVRVQASKVGTPQDKRQASRPVPLDVEVLKAVSGGKSESLQSPHKGW